MEIVALQWNLHWKDKPANYSRAAELAAAAAPGRGALVILPEMFATGYGMDVSKIGEEPDGETFRFLSSLAREHSAYVLGGVAVKDGKGRGLNQAVVAGPDGREVVRYQKMHPFSYCGEERHYDPGDAPTLWEWNGIVVAPFICYDLRFPEVYRLAARAGAELFVTIANWPVERIEHWHVLNRARAIENQAYVVGVNRCGSDPKLEYPGSTLAVDPLGNVIAGLDASEGWSKFEIDPETVRRHRRDFPFLRDMRQDIFPALTRRPLYPG